MPEAYRSLPRSVSVGHLIHLGATLVGYSIATRVPADASYLAVAVLQAVQSDALPDDCPGCSSIRLARLL